MLGGIFCIYFLGFTKLCRGCLWTWATRGATHLGVKNMAWLVMAIQIFSPCKVFHVTKEGRGELSFERARLAGLVAS